MAKVTGPLMSIDASGAFADAMVYAKLNGKPSVVDQSFSCLGICSSRMS